MKKTKFLAGEAITSPAPKWATYTFRIVFLLTTAISAWIAGTSLVEEASKVEWILILKVLDTFVWGLTRLFGVVDDKINLVDNQ